MLSLELKRFLEGSLLHNTYSAYFISYMQLSADATAELFSLFTNPGSDRVSSVHVFIVSCTELANLYSHFWEMIWENATSSI